MQRERVPAETHELSVGACLERLSGATVGRLATSVDALPVVLPVDFALDGDSILIRTRPGTKLGAALNDAVVAFEVDDYDDQSEFGWSVMVQGTAREIKTSARLEHAKSLLRALPGPTAGEDRFIELGMQIVTGRCLELGRRRGAPAKA